MKFFKAIGNAILTVLGLLLGYLIITMGRVLLVYIFTPENWTTERVVAFSGSLFGLIGIIKLFFKKKE